MILFSDKLAHLFQRKNVVVQPFPCLKAFLEDFYFTENFARLFLIRPKIGIRGQRLLVADFLFDRRSVKDAPKFREFPLSNRE